MAQVRYIHIVWNQFDQVVKVFTSIQKAQDYIVGLEFYTVSSYQLE